MEELTTKEIMTMLEAASSKAKELGISSCTAIMDVGGNLVGFLRPEGGRIGNGSLAISKAWTAIAMKRPTSVLAPIVQPGEFGFGINVSEPRICPVGGALPIIRGEDNYMGAIGVSGGTVEMDIEMCEVALKTLGFKTEFGKFSYKKE